MKKIKKPQKKAANSGPEDKYKEKSESMYDPDKFNRIMKDIPEIDWQLSLRELEFLFQHPDTEEAIKTVKFYHEQKLELFSIS